MGGGGGAPQKTCACTSPKAARWLPSLEGGAAGVDAFESPTSEKYSSTARTAPAIDHAMRVCGGADLATQ